VTKDLSTLSDADLTAALNAAERERESLRSLKHMGFRADRHAAIDAARAEAPAMLAARLSDAAGALYNPGMGVIPAIADIWLFLTDPGVAIALHEAVDALDPAHFARNPDGSERTRARHEEDLTLCAERIDALHHEEQIRGIARLRADLAAKEAALP